MIRLGPQDIKELLDSVNSAMKEASCAPNVADSGSAIESAGFGVAAVEEYSLWTLQSFRVVSAHSAIFRFVSTDKKRGTPHPRGNGKVATPKTWHTTLLAAKGALRGTEDAGPLPWIERDYTPISSAKDWECGRCDILIKIYPDGIATSWLQKLVSIAQGRVASEELRYSGA
eukprot:4426455-Amphidinium_carterae.1